MEIEREGQIDGEKIKNCCSLPDWYSSTESWERRLEIRHSGNWNRFAHC